MDDVPGKSQLFFVIIFRWAAAANSLTGCTDLPILGELQCRDQAKLKAAAI
jgi:hypothetical protein